MGDLKRAAQHVDAIASALQLVESPRGKELAAQLSSTADQVLAAMRDGKPLGHLYEEMQRRKEALRQYLDEITRD